MTKFHGNRVRNNEVIWVLREACSASFISIESPQVTNIMALLMHAGPGLATLLAIKKLAEFEIR